MARNFTLLLTSLLLVFSLTACGNDQQAGDVGGANSTTGSGANTGITGDTGSGASSGMAGDVNGSTGSGTGAGTGASDGINGQDSGTGSGTTITGNGAGQAEGTPSTTRSTIGASYDQMVRNGRVHDRDGDLTDFENAVTPGASMF